MHRDFKPDNVLVREDGRPCVLDFGLARGVAPETHQGTLTRPGAVLGTAAYMAPEQARGERGDARSDQFSFAVTTWELCTGKHPHSASVGPLRDAQALPPVLADVLQRGMSERSGDRYDSMHELLQALAKAATAKHPDLPG